MLSLTSLAGRGPLQLHMHMVDMQRAAEQGRRGKKGTSPAGRANMRLDEALEWAAGALGKIEVTEDTLAAVSRLSSSRECCPSLAVAVVGQWWRDRGARGCGCFESRRLAPLGWIVVFEGSQSGPLVALLPFAMSRACDTCILSRAECLVRRAFFVCRR